MKPFSAALRAARKAAGVTQEQMAERLEISQPNVSEIETSENLSEYTARRYAEALGLEWALVKKTRKGARR